MYAHEVLRRLLAIHDTSPFINVSVFTVKNEEYLGSSSLTFFTFLANLGICGEEGEVNMILQQQEEGFVGW